jgi:hypothetical protein
MQSPKIEYTAKECLVFLDKEMSLLSKKLTEDVNNKVISKENAREKYDYYLNIYELGMIINAVSLYSFLRKPSHSMGILMSLTYFSVFSPF